MKLYEHPAFSHLDPQFVRHLQDLIDSSSRKNNAFDTLQGLIQVNSELTQRQIPCTPDMQTALLSTFKDTLPKAQRKQFDAFFNTISKMK